MIANFAALHVVKWCLVPVFFLRSGLHNLTTDVQSLVCKPDLKKKNKAM